jgi:hypothetical protein
MLGHLPFPANQFVGFALVMCIFACFSVKDSHIGLLLSIVVAAILAWIGWLAISSALIAVVFCMAIMYAIARRKPQQ